MQPHIVIIGAGASGLTAAISAASLGAKVTILEHSSRAGQKILVTGNGKCNLTNRNQAVQYYRGDNPDFAQTVLKRFGFKETVSFFEDLGIYLKEKQGYFYPLGEQASTVSDFLRLKCMEFGVEIRCAVSVNSIKREKEKFIIKINENDAHETLSAFHVILACGGKAAPKTGSDGSGFILAEKLGHTIVKPLPALVPLICKETFFKEISGVRCQGKITLLINGKQTVSDLGELQMTNYGVSGIPVFQISRYASKAIDQGEKVQVLIDFMPGWEKAELTSFLVSQSRQNPYRCMEQHLYGILNKKLAVLLLKQAGIPLTLKGKEISASHIEKIVSRIKEFRAEVVRPGTFEQAQVCAGGVNTKEVNSDTMESKLVKHLYFAGELLDVDGACGGYNLQWAWSSGFLAGKAATERSTL